MEEMKWFSSALLGVLAADKLGFGLCMAEICQTFGQRHSANKKAWHVQNQPHRDIIAWYHHSLDPYGGNEMVQQCLAWCDGCKKQWFWHGSG